MLKQRILTAIVLLAVLLAAVAATSPWPLLLIIVVAASCCLWEWLRLVWPRRPSQAPLLVALAVGAGMLFMTYLWFQPSVAPWALSLVSMSLYGLLVPVTLIWLVGATSAVFAARSDQAPGSWWWSAFGILAIVSVWLSLTRLYLQFGSWFIISLLALIWAADIAAYFCGKAFGRHKLAPRVSPGKTWEGALGGVVAAVLWVVISARWPNSFGAYLDQHFSFPVIVVLAAFLAALSIIGDLFESLLKRRAGVKDSSHLLPGHGGVYDRIDALLPIAPLAFLLTAVIV